MTYLDPRQVEYLLRAPAEGRIVRRTENGKTLSYMEGHDVKAQLIRVFGFGRFSSEVVSQECVLDEPVKIGKEKDKDGFKVAYRSVVRLTVCAPDGTTLATYTEGHVGQSIHPDRAEAHANALTNSETYALKRCAIFLGDGFGLGLYNGGFTGSYVRFAFRPDAEHPVSEEELPRVKPESEYSEPAPDLHVQSQPPAETPEDQRELRVKDFTAQLLGADSRSKVASVSAQVMKEGLGAALTFDADENAVTLGALVDASLKRVTARARASA